VSELQLLLTLVVLILGLVLTARWFPHEPTLEEWLIRFQEAVDGFATVIGQAFIPAVEAATESLQAFADAFNGPIQE
jgi:hypothetical protein